MSTNDQTKQTGAPIYTQRVLHRPGAKYVIMERVPVEGALPDGQCRFFTPIDVRDGDGNVLAAGTVEYTDAANAAQAFDCSEELVRPAQEALVKQVKSMLVQEALKRGVPPASRLNGLRG